MIEAVQADGTCWLGGTTWQGMAAMRISVSNWSTTEEDVDRSVEPRSCAPARVVAVAQPYAARKYLLGCHRVELGIYTFAELTPDPETGRTISPAERLRNLVEEIELADQVGLDVFGVGEHHRPDFAVSSPAVVLAAGAERTKRIRLTSAVSVISSDDPVRVFQDFATLDLLSGGRAEIMAGRGSFIESFPLFGYDLADYDELFDEKLELLLALRDERARHLVGHAPRRRSTGRGVYPRPLQDPLPVWVAVGGSPESAARAGMLGLPMALAIIGGLPERFAPFAEIHREAARRAGHEPARRSASTRTASSPRRRRPPPTSPSRRSCTR